MSDYFRHGDLGQASYDCEIIPFDDSEFELAVLPRLKEGDSLLIVDPFDGARIRVLTRLGPVYIWQSGFKRVR